MATQAVTIAQDASSDAGWRTWGQAIHNALVALGTLVQTSDTGQANWSTATRASGANELWRFADSQQGTAPVFIKLNFGNSGSSPQLLISVGTGTNGAGTLTGNVSSTQSVVNFTFTATPQQYYFSSTTSRLTLWGEADHNNGAGAAGTLWTIERPHDNTGAEVGTGIILAYANDSLSRYNVEWVSQGAALPATDSIGFSRAFIVDSESTLIGAQMTAFTGNPVGINHQIQNSLLGILLYWSADLGIGAVGSLPTITVYGVAHSYINTSATPHSFGISSGYAAMMLYE